MAAERRRSLWGFLVALLGVWLVHALTAAWTQDEGTYLYLAQRILTAGELPYRDFAYTQMPVYLYLLAPWLAVVPAPILAGRLFAFVCFALLLVRIVLWARRRGCSDRAVAVGLVLCVFHPLIWDYFALVKPYALTALLLWLSLETLSEGKGAFLSGACLGLAMGVRMNFLLALPIHLVFLRRRALRSGPFFLGLALAGLPTFLSFALSPDAFVFNVFRYHAIRSGLGGGQAWAQRWATLQFAATSFSSFCVWVLVIWLGWKKTFRWEDGSWAFAAVLILVPLLSLSPFYDEYLSTSYLLLMAALIPALSRAAWPRWAGTVVALVFVGAFIRAEWGALGAMVSGHDSRAYSLASVARVAAEIAARTEPDDQVLSFWAGYALEARRTLMPGSEIGISVREMAGKLTGEEHRKYRIASGREIGMWIARRIPKLVVVGLGAPPDLEPLLAGRYRLAVETGGARLYVR